LWLLQIAENCIDLWWDFFYKGCELIQVAKMSESKTFLPPFFCFKTKVLSGKAKKCGAFFLTLFYLSAAACRAALLRRIK
jgi:hypothetical protein